MLANRLWGWVCLLAAVVLSVMTMHAHGFGLVQQLRFVAALLVQVLLPGLVLTGWMRRQTLFAQLSTAYVLGLPLQLIGWALGVAVGVPLLIWLVPAAFGVVGLALGRRRLVRNLRTRVEMGALQATVLLLGWLVMLGRFAETWTAHASGSKATDWYQDMYWHLAINASAMHRLPTQDPQAIGETLSYHWLTNGHVAALARSADLDLVPLTAFAWNLPAAAALLGVTFGLAHHLTRATWAGVLAASFVVIAPAFELNASLDLIGSDSFAPLSPSHMLGMPTTVVAVWLLVVALRGGRSRRRAIWLPGALLLVLVSGVKVSTLPVLACGIIAAGLSTLLWRRRRVLATLLLVAVGATLVATFPLFGGGGGGSSVQWLGGFKLRGLWQASAHELAVRGPLADTALLHGFVGFALLNLLWIAPGIAAMRWKDPAGWLLLGVISSAVGVTFVLSHPGKSEIYFPMGIQPIMAVAGAVGVVWFARRAADHAQLLWASGGVAIVAGAWLGTMPHLTKFTMGKMVAHYGLLAGGLVLAALAIWALGRRVGAAAVAVAIVGVAAGPGLHQAMDGARYVHLILSEVQERIEQRQPGDRTISPDEMAALDHVAALPTDAVLATNIHCQGVATSEHCDARAFWVAGHGRHRVLLGGWGYTTLGRSTQGDGGRYHVNNPYPDEQLFALNERAFTAPDEATFDELRERGVTHLFADRQASAVAPLDTWCETTFENETVTVCAIR